MLPSKRAPSHPGEILLKEFLEPGNITQKVFAKHLGWPYARLNKIINAKRGLTADSAISIAEAFKMEAEFWLNLQRDWELWHAYNQHKTVKPFKNGYWPLNTGVAPR